MKLYTPHPALTPAQTFDRAAFGVGGIITSRYQPPERVGDPLPSRLAAMSMGTASGAPGLPPMHALSLAPPSQQPGGAMNGGGSGGGTRTGPPPRPSWRRTLGKTPVDSRRLGGAGGRRGRACRP